MSKKNADARHGDAVLSQEEFEKAIDEYNKRKAEREKTDADDVGDVEVKKEEKELPGGVEAQVAEVKARRDRRDEAGDPKDLEESMSVIAHQDEDLDILFDIIDTLLAKQDFDAAEPVEEEKVEEEFVDEENKDEIDKLNKLNGDADEEEVPEDEEVTEEETVTEEEPVDEEEELAEDADDLPEDEEVTEEEEDWKEDGCGKDERMDSAASRAIRNHMMMGKIGRQVGLKNLEYKGIKDAKVAVIKAVRPDMRLDGKSDAYINGAFDNAVKSIKAKKTKGVSYQKRQMFHKDSADVVASGNISANDARRRMIERQAKNK